MMSSSSEVASAVLEVTSEAKTVSKCDDVSHCSSAEAEGAIHTPSSEESLSIPRLVKDCIPSVSGADIHSTVDNPQKIVETWGTYISFRITTKCARWGNEHQEFVVRRRYNDFKALRDRLVENSLQIVPPLPCRHTLLAQLDRYSKDFVLQRMALLNIFIRRVTTHTILSHDNDLKVFLTASQSEFQQHFKSKSGYLSSLQDSLYSLASNNPQISSGAVSRVRDPEFVSANEYMTSLREKFEFLHSVFTRVNKERAEYAEEMVTMRPIFDCWSQTEHFNRDTLKRIPDRSVNRSHPLGEILKVISSPYVVISAEYLKMSKEYPYTLGNPIKEYMLYVDAVKERLHGRDALQAGLETAQNKSNRLKTAADSREVEAIHDRLQCASEALRSDLASWQRQKKTDLKMILLEMAKKHIEVYEKSVAAWEALLPSISVPDEAIDSKKMMIPGAEKEFFKQMGSIMSKNGNVANGSKPINWDAIEQDIDK